MAKNQFLESAEATKEIVLLINAALVRQLRHGRSSLVMSHQFEQK